MTLKQITVMINVLLGVNYCPHQPIMTRDQRVIRGHIRTNESEGPDNLPLTAAFISDRLRRWRGQRIIGRDELLLKQKNVLILERDMGHLPDPQRDLHQTLT